jgi:hypothetical protein
MEENLNPSEDVIVPMEDTIVDPLAEVDDTATIENQIEETPTEVII